MPKLDFDLTDLLAVDFDPRRTKVWIDTNVTGPLVDTTNKQIRIGPAPTTIGNDGKGSFAGLIATNSTDLRVDQRNFLYQVHVDYSARGARERGRWDSGWFALTADSDLSLVATVPNAPAVVTQDSVLASTVSNPASATSAALMATYVSALTPEAFGAVGDGVTDDSAAFAALQASGLSRLAVLQRGRTYKLGSSVTITKELDLNGATLDITGRLTLTSGKMRNGTVTVTDKILVDSVSGVRIFDVTSHIAGSTSDGLAILDCDDVVVGYCTRTGGKRGIMLDRCTNFQVFHNTISDVAAAGAYGILIRGADNTITGEGSVTDNTITDCRYGIALWGGEANSANAGFIANDYALQRITVARNKVIVTDPDASSHRGCIFATRSRWITISDNMIDGGIDVGVDFEYCADSQAIGNTVSNIYAGGLAAIFGSKRIKFLGNKVTFTRTKTGTASTSGVTWKNTSNVGLLLRDDPQEVEVSSNTFHSLNGTLMQLSGSEASDGVTFKGNDMLNAYFVAFNTVAGTCTDMDLSRNRARFTVNINRPVLMAQVVNGFTAHGNDIALMAGEVQESNLRPTISVYDPSTAYSSDVSVRLNRVKDPAGATNNQIGIVSGSTTLVAEITDNTADRIVTSYAGGALRSGFTYGRNVPTTGAGGVVRLTANDNATVIIPSPRTTRQFVRATATAGLTLTDSDFYVFTGASGVTWTLPPITGYTGAIITIKNRGTAAITLNSSGGATDIFDTAAVATLNIAAGAVVRLLNDGTRWCTI